MRVPFQPFTSADTFRRGAVNRNISRAEHVEAITKCARKGAIDIKPGVLDAATEKMGGREDSGEAVCSCELGDRIGGLLSRRTKQVSR